MQVEKKNSYVTFATSDIITAERKKRKYMRMFTIFHAVIYYGQNVRVYVCRGDKMSTATATAASIKPMEWHHLCSTDTMASSSICMQSTKQCKKKKQ